MAELRFKLSPTKKLPFKLIGDLTTIGRDPNNSIVIDHPSISPFHAEILLVHSEDRYEVFDLGSPHGTKVNEEQIIRKELVHGDEIKFGHLVAEIIIAVEKDAPDNQLGEKPETKEKKSVAARAASRPPTPKLVKAPPNKKVDPSADEKINKLEVQTTTSDSVKKKIKSDSVSKEQLQKFDQLEKELEKAKLHILDLKNSNKKLKSEIGKNYSPSQLKGTLKKFKKKNKSLKKEASALREKIRKGKLNLRTLLKKNLSFQARRIH